MALTRKLRKAYTGVGLVYVVKDFLADSHVEADSKNTGLDPVAAASGLDER